MPVVLVPNDDASCPDARGTCSVGDVDCEDANSVHTVQLYSEVSDDDFADCSDEFLEEVNKLERDYFEKLHVDNVEENETFAESPTIWHKKPLSELETQNFHVYNVTPDRPCSAYFKTDSYMPASEIFEALSKEGFKAEHIRCLQRKPSGEIFLTFRSQRIRDEFLSRSAFVTRRRSYVTHDSERPLSFLTIYDAPYELPDAAIIHRLSPYCEVIWYRRGTFKGHGGVFNGLRHYRVRADFNIPSYLRFGKFLIRLYYDGQTPTCRRCNRTGHKAAQCRNTLCFNCDGLGHVSRECVRPMYCCICKSGQHLARTCPFSWLRAPLSTDGGDVSGGEDPGNSERGADAVRDGSPNDRDGDNDDGDNDDEILPDDRPSGDIDVQSDGVFHASDGDFSPDATPLGSDPAEISLPLDQVPIFSSDSPQAPESLPANEPSSDVVTTVRAADVVTPSPVLDSEGLIVAEKRPVEKQRVDQARTTPPVSSSPCAQKSWADAVDSTPAPVKPSVSMPGSQRNAPRPQRGKISRRKPAPVSASLPALGRRATLPSKVPSSKKQPDPAADVNPEPLTEDMDLSGVTRKRKTVADLEECPEGKLPATR